MLLDTSGLLCLHFRTEPHYDTARDLFFAAPGRLTHPYVLAEYPAAVTARRLNRPAALEFLTTLRENPDIEVVWVDEKLHHEAVDLLLARPDKTYSLCDAVSFILMRQRRMTDALTTDKHFEQEGFRRLLV